MMLWVIFAFMTAAAVLAVLWPLGRTPKVDQGSGDLAVYKDQLAEIARDRAAGLLGESEAEAARVEVSRRLLAAADAEAAARGGPAPTARPQWRRRAAAITAALGVPALALALYVPLGSPNVPDQPAFGRVKTAQGSQSIEQMIGQVEAHLARDPNDGQGWEVIAPIYLRLGRFDDAVMALRKAITLNGDSATRESGLGEALVAAANGVVTAEAKAAFQHALDTDPQDAKARYFLGLADEQDGDREAAAAKWRALLDQAPPNAPWTGFVRAALARVTEAAGSIGGAGGSDNAAASMTDQQRNDMIRGMVQRLADRLHANGDDVDGWMRLLRAYMVLEDRDKAKAAAAEARRALASRPEAVKQIDDLVQSLGLNG